MLKFYQYDLKIATLVKWHWWNKVYFYDKKSCTLIYRYYNGHNSPSRQAKGLQLTLLESSVLTKEEKHKLRNSMSTGPLHRKNGLAINLTIHCTLSSEVSHKFIIKVLIVQVVLLYSVGHALHFHSLLVCLSL